VTRAFFEQEAADNKNPAAASVRWAGCAATL